MKSEPRSEVKLLMYPPTGLLLSDRFSQLARGLFVCPYSGSGHFDCQAVQRTLVRKSLIVNSVSTGSIA